MTICTLIFVTPTKDLFPVQINLVGGTNILIKVLKIKSIY